MSAVDPLRQARLAYQLRSDHMLDEWRHRTPNYNPFDTMRQQNAVDPVVQQLRPFAGQLTTGPAVDALKEQYDRRVLVGTSGQNPHQLLHAQRMFRAALKFRGPTDPTTKLWQTRVEGFHTLATPTPEVHHQDVYK